MASQVNLQNNFTSITDIADAMDSFYQIVGSDTFFEDTFSGLDVLNSVTDNNYIEDVYTSTQIAGRVNIPNVGTASFVIQGRNLDSYSFTATSMTVNTPSGVNVGMYGSLKLNGNYDLVGSIKRFEVLNTITSDKVTFIGNMDFMSETGVYTALQVESHGAKYVLSGNFTVDSMGNESGTVTGLSIVTPSNAFAVSNLSINYADFVDYSSEQFLETLLGGNSVINGTKGNDTLFGLDGDNTLFGLAGNDTLHGGAGDDKLDGGKGADRLIGGLGNDTFIVDSASDVVVEQSGEGTDTVQSAVNYTLTDNLENLTLTGKAAAGTGNALNNTLTGNASNNTLNGGLGADTLIGGKGNDTYIIDNTGDTITENANEGTDLVKSSVSYTLAANLENLNLEGTSDIDATGNALNNTINGNAGRNIINGGAGADKMTGGAGWDTYYVDNVKDIIKEAAIAADDEDTVYASIDYTLAANVELLYLTGSAIKGTGNGLDNLIEGNGNNNILNGAAGDDGLVGGLGKDTLTGGKGEDVFLFSAADESVFGANHDIITDFKHGEDRVGLFMDANTLVANYQSFNFIGSNTFSNVAGELRFDAATHSVLGDINGDGVADLQIELTGVTSMQASDFVLI